MSIVYNKINMYVIQLCNTLFNQSRPSKMGVASFPDQSRFLCQVTFAAAKSSNEQNKTVQTL